MSKRKTNAQCVANIMNFSAYGPLSQIFVMNALTTAAEAVITAGVQALPENGAVAPEAWVGVAQEILDKIKTHFAEAV